MSSQETNDYAPPEAIARGRRDGPAAREQTIILTPEEQLAFWNALKETPLLTDAQKDLGSLMRGES